MKELTKFTHEGLEIKIMYNQVVDELELYISDPNSSTPHDTAMVSINQQFTFGKMCLRSLKR